LGRLYAYWEANSRQIIDMPTLCRFALATGMRLSEITGLQIEDIRRTAADRAD
jgi:integrase